MDETPNLTLPYIMAAQAQKHVTHNEALRALDAVVQLSVLDRDRARLWGSPAVRGSATASPPARLARWAGHEG